MEIASECCEQGLKYRTKFSSRSDMICMCVCSKQKSIRSFSTSIRSARDSSKACKKARKQDVTSNGFRAWRSWVRRMRRGVKPQSGFRCAGRKTERVGGTQQSNEHQKTTKQVKKEKAEERKAAYLHGPRQLKDDGPRNPNCLDPPDLDHQARKL